MRVRFRSLSEREVVNLADGARIGLLGECDLVVDERSGRIEALVLRRRGSSLFSGRRELVVPWRNIRRVGPDLVIIESPTGKE